MSSSLLPLPRVFNIRPCTPRHAMPCRAAPRRQARSRKGDVPALRQAEPAVRYVMSVCAYVYVYVWCDTHEPTIVVVVLHKFLLFLCMHSWFLRDLKLQLQHNMLLQRNLGLQLLLVLQFFLERDNIYEKL